ncbi:cupin domain-containing protein [Paenibacillus pabuli]|uniref:cupin domain-containing protein n=1 Tax=Paenibacillus pabuli TaxID=1472 RepID=UPI001FFEFF65|nr:cupin domain-containing protein [Paenibacillus pabuli]UPK45625.1 cupin domain-containing protein [Paenibacillus pabuli]
MKIYRLKPEDRRSIIAYNSEGAEITPILRSTTACHIAQLKLSAGGTLGLHPAVGEQVFLVLEGEGWVVGETGERVVVHPGDAAYWSNGENHQSGSDKGLTALLIEGEELIVRLSLEAGDS